jgi:hypothetical protein
MVCPRRKEVMATNGDYAIIYLLPFLVCVFNVLVDKLSTI